MDELRNNDRPVSSDIEDAESVRPRTDTPAGDESGVETVARIPLSRSVVIDERQQPLATSEPLPLSSSASEANARTVHINTVGTDAATGAVPAAARQAAPETDPQRSRSNAAPPTDSSSEQAMGALFPQAELQEFRARWDQVQASFVDDPRRAAQDADNLVASVVKRIADQFAEQRSKLEGQWSQGGDATTEELRRGLRQYRAFFERLLSM